VDKSAFARLHHQVIATVLNPLIRAGHVARCGIFELEVLFSARSAQDIELTRNDLSQALPLAETTQHDFERAAAVMQLLAENGLHRSVPVPDLVLAAVAERHGLTILHYDADFDHIAEMTGQTAHWVLPRGSVP
jgi:predicted nucleic acid-binding protein